MSVRSLAPWDLGGQLLSNLAAPVANTDAATKQYVDGKAGGLPVFNVKDYGAVGDGSTDDSAAIASAAAAAGTANHGGTVYFPYGTYRIAAAWTGLSSLTNVKILGQGGGGTAGSGVILKCDAALSSGTGFSLASSANLDFRNITFQLTAHTGNTVNVVDLTGAADITFTDCAFVSNNAGSRQGRGISLATAQRVRVDRCYFYNLNQSLYGSTSSIDITVRDCNFNTFNNGCYAPWQNYAITGCEFYDAAASSTQALVVMNGATNAYIASNRMRHANTTAISGGIIQIAAVADVVIVGNALDASAASSAAHKVLYVSGNPTGLVVAGNSFNSNGGTALNWSSNTDTGSGVFIGNTYGSGNAAKLSNLPVGGNYRFIESADNTYNVKDFGAKGDGATDDSAALTAAATAANASSGGTVYFPKGTYIVASAWTYLDNKKNIKFVGAGSGRVTTPAVVIRSTYAAGAATNIFSAQNTSGLEFVGIQFETTGATSNTAQLWNLLNATDLTFSGCYFRNATGTARLGQGLYLLGAKRVTVERCTFETFRSAMIGNNTAANVNVRDCYFNLYNVAIDSAGLHWTIQNTQFNDDGTATGITCIANTTSALTVQGCRFDNPGAVAGQILAMGYGINIIGNHFAASLTAGAQAIRVTNYCYGINITGNNFFTADTAINFTASGYFANGFIGNNQFGTAQTARYANVNSNTSSVRDDLRPDADGTHPLMYNGARWYALNDGPTGSSLTMVSGTGYAVPFIPSRPAAFNGNALALQIVAAASAGTIRAGIYNDSGGLPGTLVSDLGTVAATATGVVGWTLTKTLNPGFYWIVVAGQGLTGTLTVTYVTSRSRFIPIAGASADVTMFNNSLGCVYWSTLGSGAMPPSWTSTDGASIAPALMIRMS